MHRTGRLQGQAEAHDTCSTTACAGGQQPGLLFIGWVGGSSPPPPPSSDKFVEVPKAPKKVFGLNYLVPKAPQKIF